MASVNGVSSSNMTSSLYNSGKVISGLASGMDTESMIEGLVKSYQTKINQLSQKVTKYEWKQEAYRGLISQLAGFASKYTSYTSNTNLTSRSFFSSAVKVLTKGDFASSVSATGKTSSDVALNAVHQLATAAQIRTKSNLTQGDPSVIEGTSTNLFDDKTINLSNLSGGLTLTYGSKTVSLSFSATNDVKAMEDIRKSLETKKGEGNVSESDVLAELINQKLADEDIVFTNGNVEKANERIEASVDGSGNIVFKELGTASNGVYISGASGNIASQLGLKDSDLKNAKDVKPKTLTLSSEIREKGLTRSMTSIDYLAEKGATVMNISLDGNTKTIKMPTVEKTEEEGKYLINGKEVTEDDFAQKYTDALSEAVNAQFGGKVKVSNEGEGKELKLKFEVGEGSQLALNSSVGDALGVGNIATSYLNTSKTLKDLMGGKLDTLEPVYEKDENGDDKLDDKNQPIAKTDERGRKLYAFEINGVKIGEYTEDTSLATILSDINSNEDAGVKVGYSQTTQSFTFTAKETGADSKVEFGGGLATAMFGASGDSKVGDTYGLNLGANETKDVTFKVGGFKSELTIDSNTTMDDIAKDLNKTWKNMGYSVSYNEGSGQLVVTDSAGKKVDLTASADGEELKSTSYTPGQNAKFTVTVNGEQINMERSSNNVDVDGLKITMSETFNSKKNSSGAYSVAEANKSVTFQSKTDSDKIVDAIKAMAEDYNSMMADLKKAYGTMPYQKSSGAFANYEPLTDDDRAGMSESAIERYEEKAKQGILFGDRDLSNLYSKLSDVFSFNTTKDVDTLREMGIELSYNISDGAQTLKIDEGKLRAMLDSDPDRVSDIFTRTDGIMDRMKTQLDTYAKTVGEPKGILIQKAGSPLSSLSLMNNEWQTQIDNINKQIEKWQTKMSNQVDRYTSMFSRLEILINQMNSQSSTLAGLMGG